MPLHLVDLRKIGRLSKLQGGREFGLSSPIHHGSYYGYREYRSLLNNSSSRCWAERTETATGYHNRARASRNQTELPSLPPFDPILHFARPDIVPCAFYSHFRFLEMYKKLQSRSEAAMLSQRCVSDCMRETANDSRSRLIYSPTDDGNATHTKKAFIYNTTVDD
jgi:hypothetical protein